MGNGLIQDRMEGIVGEGNLLACIVEWGGSNVGPGELVRDSLGGYMVGELDGTISDRARSLAAALEPVGRTRVTGQRARDDLVQAADQLDLHRAVRGLRAALRRRRRAGPRRGLLPLAARASRSATHRASSWSRSTTSIRTTFDEAGLATMMEHMANVRPSMLQDLDAGRDTEVDVVNGGVAGKGRELGIATPCNDAVVELVHSMERGERSSEPRWLRYVSDAQTISATDS